MDEEERAAYAEALGEKLESWNIRATLGFAGLYLMTHEAIKEAVIDGVRNFYLNGFDENGMTYDEDLYAADVLARDPKKRKMRASLLWLVHSGAITLEQADRLDDIYAHRHELTHELTKYIMDPAFNPDMNLFTDAMQILKDVLRYWTEVEFAIGTFEDHPDAGVDDVTPGRLVPLQLAIFAYVEGLDHEVERQKAQESPDPS
ncbi:hypothetical protein ACIA5C_48320 [Actinoplanes sp. NPDC051343]|uniref:hypothetical protein n=1 Tax=Actinoplanes sp. NPDC051343 TaxID=3363906 RepID=UPI0037A05C6F